VKYCLGLHWASIATATSATEHASERSTSTAKELGKEVLSGHATAGTALLEALFTELVVELALLGIG